MLASSVDRVIKALEFDAREKQAGRRPLFFPRAWFGRSAASEQNGWHITEGDLRAILGPGLPPLLTVPEFAELIRFDRWTMYQLVKQGFVPSRKVLGHLRISSRTYWELPEERPPLIQTAAQARRRRSFFSRKSQVSGLNSEHEEGEEA